MAAAFYARLFELDPGLRPLFKADMAAQGRKLMAMIATAVANLHNLGEIIPAVQQLGEPPCRLRRKDQDYDTVASALLWTLSRDSAKRSPRQPATPGLRLPTLAGVMQQAAAAV